MLYAQPLFGFKMTAAEVAENRSLYKHVLHKG